MGLAGVNDLKFFRSFSNLAQAVQVRKDQVGALVSSGAAGEAMVTRRIEDRPVFLRTVSKS